MLHQEKLLKTQDDLQAEASVVLCLEELVLKISKKLIPRQQVLATASDC